MNEAWYGAWLQKDAATVERLMAKEYVYVAPNGQVLDRDAILAIIRSPTYRLYNGSRTEVVVTTIGEDAAVVRHRWQGAGTFDGNSFEDDHRCTMVCGRRGGEWQVVAEQCSANIRPSERAPLMILVAGPYRSGTNDDPALIAANVRSMAETALRLFRAGHLPVLGEWFALPLIELAGSRSIGDAIFNEIFHPISRTLVAKCDACLRIGGPSQGADEMVALAKSLGKQVFLRYADVPGCS
jgi:hypothetical protein